MEEATHWYRRLAHVSGSAIVAYYFLPDDGWIGLTKRILVTLAVLVVIAIDIMRIKHAKLNISGLRDYEKGRIGSYVYFGIGSSILLLLFPQQITIPCIVSTSLVDPLAGEMRKVNPFLSYLSSLLLAYFIFLSTWISSPYSIYIALLGASSLTLSELVKIECLDDNLLMQLIPAILILLTVVIFGENVLPREMILPLVE